MGKLHSRSAGLQRHHLEIAIICVSGVRLCSALTALGIHGSAWSLTLVHVASLLLEFGYSKLASPYCLRKCESHGLAQGVLAVPSVLAALATVAPQGAWIIWMLSSCGAAASILMTVYLQSLSAAAAAKKKAVAARGHHVPALADYTAGSSQPTTNGLAQQQQQHNHLVHNHKPQGQQQRNSSIKQQLKTVLPAVLCGLLAVGAGWLASMQHSSPALFAMQQQQKHQQHLYQQQQDPAEAVWLLVAATGLGAAVAAVLYCLIMHMLPSCFSIGEGALLAQGAAGLAVAAAMAAPDAAAFVPTVACQLLPQSALDIVVGLGGCTSEAQSRALSLEALPSAIVLVLASTLLVCLLLRAMLAVLGISCSSTSSIEGQPAAEAAVSARKAAAAATGNSRKPGSSNSSSWSSHARGLHSWLLAAALCAGMGVALLWLGCGAAWTLLEFLPARQGRLMVLLYWVGLLGVTLPALRLWASHSRMPQIIVRKVYHLLAGGLFVPVFFWDLQLLCLSLAIAFAALVLLEVLRRLQLPGLGQAVQHFMQDFVDERDSGVIYVTHFTLLLGLAVPMWLCLGVPGIQAFVGERVLTSSSMQCGSSSSAGSCMRNDATTAAAAAGTVNAPGLNLSQDELPSNALLLVMAGLSGMVIIGVGDTAASMVGKLLGRVPIHAGSRKTVEGTVAGITSSLGAWCLLLWCVGLGGGGWQWWLQLLMATAGAGLMEACTSQLDNILLPLWYLPHLVLVQR